jgi:hypothetical protein
MNAKCERCPRKNALLVEITDPRDYSVTRLLLCQPCRAKQRVKPVERGHAASKTNA